jgi:SAM-dependent methyltransferase
MLRKFKRTVRAALTRVKSIRQLPTALMVVGARRQTPSYLLYVCAQLEKSRPYASKVSARTQRLVSKLVAAAGTRAEERHNAAVLCVGCRNVHELQLLRDAGYGSVTGIDLFSSSAEIVTMDMHALRFPDAQFDVVYSCHSLEHSIDPDAAVAEFVRVCKPGAVIVVEVPVRFAVSSTDLQDYRSIDGLRTLFQPHLSELVLAEDERDETGTDVVRMVFRVAKPAPAGVRVESS